MRTNCLLPLILSGLPTALALRPNMAVSIAEVFWPPTMDYAAWLPEDDTCICSSAVPISENKPFSIGGEDGFTFSDYWSPTSMKLMKDHKEIADCFIGPDAVKRDICGSERGNKLLGHVTKRWTCWTKGKEVKMDDASKGGSGTRGGAAKPYWES